MLCCFHVPILFLARVIDQESLIDSLKSSLAAHQPSSPPLCAPPTDRSSRRIDIDCIRLPSHNLNTHAHIRLVKDMSVH